ncbi:recombinase family protein [Streptomyces sp. NPDC090056]|uniref:recombinase family protein n=1 Tax=Streptomyces sp. NPDC090056 TaxID=3365934 RepID=UPI0037F6C5AE
MLHPHGNSVLRDHQDPSASGVQNPGSRPLDTLTPGGRLIFHVFAALAEFIRELIVQGTNEGLAAARARGRVGGRPSVVNDKLLRAARDMLPNPENSIETIAALLGISVGTLYNHIPDLKELRTSRVPYQLDNGQR